MFKDSKLIRSLTGNSENINLKGANYLVEEIRKETVRYAIKTKVF